MGSSIGVIIGVVVLLVSIGFVVLMMVGEWSQSGDAAPAEAEVPAAPAPVRASAPASRRPAPKKKAAPKAAKKKAAKKSKKK